MNKLCLIVLVLVGCGCFKSSDSKYADVFWYKLPYDIPEERGVIKSHHNHELRLSKRHIVCPFSIVLDDANGKQDPLTSVKIACINGHCSIWHGEVDVKLGKKKYEAKNGKVWVEIRWQRLSKIEFGYREIIEVSEISEAQFFNVAREYLTSVRVVELDGRRVVVGGCGRLKGYVLKDYVEPVFHK